MITEEEKKEIIAETIEQVFIMLPEVIGNLMVANSVYSKLTKEFYETHTGFKNNRDIVRVVVSQIEEANPTKDYSDILAEAAPKIKSIIESKKPLSMNNLKLAEVNLNVDKESFLSDSNISDNGLL